MIEFNATFIIAMFSFVVFILIMNAIFYNPILNIIRKREDYINSNYEDSKRFEESAREISTTRDSKLEQVKDKCKHEFKNAIDDIQLEANSKIKSAKENSKTVLQTQKEKLLEEEAILKTELKNTVVKDLASSIASKLLGMETNVEKTDYKQVNQVMD